MAPGRLTTALVVAAAAAAAATLASLPLAAGDTWPQFRGPRSSATAEGAGLPAAWSASENSENIVWRLPLSGMAWSSPIVWKSKVFFTNAVSEGEEETPRKGLYFGGNRSTPSAHIHRHLVTCVDFDSGRVLWERLAQAGPPRTTRHLKNSYASETPCTDGERVYAYFGSLGLLHAYDLEGELQWARQWETFETRYDWGSAASPVVHEGRVYLLNDNEESSFLEALDAESGEKRWRVARDEKSNWSTPFVWSHEARTEVVTAGSNGVRSYALDGTLLWQLRGMSSIAIPTPFAGLGLLHVGSGYVGDDHRPLYAIRPGAAGDITLEEGAASSPAVAWYLRQAAPYNPTPVYFEGSVYVLYDRGFLAAFDARTGEALYAGEEKRRLARQANAFTASPWAYNGHIFCLSEDGDTFVVRAGPEFEVVRVNSLEEMCMATPAIAGESLILRTAEALYRIGAPSAAQ
jgi:outer membrane protein assembly factor BamB